MARNATPKAPTSAPVRRKPAPAAKPQVAAKAPVKAAVKTKAKAAAPKAAPAPKAAKPAAVAKAKPVAAEKPAKLKHKLVRDSFTMPKADFDLIAVLKERALGFRQPVKKSELLRAGLQVLNSLPDTSLQAALGELVALKPGRPKTAA